MLLTVLGMCPAGLRAACGQDIRISGYQGIRVSGSRTADRRLPCPEDTLFVVSGDAMVIAMICAHQQCARAVLMTFAFVRC